MHYREKEVCNYQGSTTALVINNHELDDNQFPSSWWRSLNINYPDTAISGGMYEHHAMATSSSGIITVIFTGKINRNNTKIIVVSPYDDF